MEQKSKIHSAPEVKDFELKKVLNNILHKLQNIDDVLIDVVRLQERSNMQARTLSLIETRLESYDQRIHKTEIDQAALRSLAESHKTLVEDVEGCSHQINKMKQDNAKAEGARRVFRYINHTIVGMVVAVMIYRCTEG